MHIVKPYYGMTFHVAKHLQGPSIVTISFPSYDDAQSFFVALQKASGFGITDVSRESPRAFELTVSPCYNVDKKWLAGFFEFVKESKGKDYTDFVMEINDSGTVGWHLF